MIQTLLLLCGPKFPSLEGKRKMLLPPIRRMSRLFFLLHLPCNSPWVAMDNNPPKKDGCNLNHNSSLLINVVVVINEELNHCHSSEIRGFLLDEIFQIFQNQIQALDIARLQGIHYYNSRVVIYTGPSANVIVVARKKSRQLKFTLCKPSSNNMISRYAKLLTKKIPIA